MRGKSKNKKSKKVVTSIVVLLVVIIAGVWIIPGIVDAQNSKTATGQTSAQTRTLTVGIQDIKQSVTGSGEIVTGEEETLEADSDKTVDTVKAVEGQAVKKGAVLLTYTDGTAVAAPFNGVISKVTLADDTGSNQQNASQATDSIVIMSTDNLVTNLSVDESDLKNIKAGQSADITINAFPDTKFTGKVTSISETGTYENGSSKFQIAIKLDKTTNVKIGMSAAVDITVKSVTEAVSVPIEAVRGSGDNATVMLVNSDGSASPVPVTLGLANQAYVQIVSGLSEGDRIQYTVQSSGNSSMMSGFGGFGGGMISPNGSTQGRFGGGNGTGSRTMGDGNTARPQN